MDEVLDIHQRDAETPCANWQCGKEYSVALAPARGCWCTASGKSSPWRGSGGDICDRGDRYLSTGVFGEEHFTRGRGFKIIAQAPFYPSAQLRM